MVVSSEILRDAFSTEVFYAEPLQYYYLLFQITVYHRPYCFPRFVGVLCLDDVSLCVPVCPCVYLVPVLLTDSHFFGFRARGHENLFQLIFLKEVGHFSRVQHVVDVLQKAFHHDLPQETQEYTTYFCMCKKQICRDSHSGG